jgi:molybdate transport system substrate-binding protein
VNRRAIAVLATIAIAAACQSPAETRLTSLPAQSSNASGSRARSAEGAALTIYGAASLKGALDRMKTSYEASHSRTTLTITTDSSATLRTQIEQGAPADVFLSADITNPKELVDGGLADGDLVDFAGNLLTIVVPTTNPAKVASPADLARSGVKVVAAGDQVPITKYANQAVDLLAKLPGYPGGYAASYAANVVSKEDNVKALIAKIELGEGDAGIVYVTDARASTKVGDVAIPPRANVPAVYAGVVVKSSRNVAAAHAFLDWIAGADGQKILATFGFIPPQT